MSRPVAICADVGSTFTKAAAVDLDGGTLLATAEHRTTVDTDVLHGLDAAIARATPPDASVEAVHVCSSAGGGLRLAVVGYEPLVTAEAGHRVGLSAGARVVHVAGGRLDGAGVAELRAARPDVVLLVGGTDGGDAEVLHHNALRLAKARLTARRARIPIVVAGNIEVRDDVVRSLEDSGAPVVATANVLPRIGVLNPGPARAAIREVFLRHVIGGKGLSRGPRFASLVRAATPDAVLTAVELLAEMIGGDLAVVDIGGATTDVYSVLDPTDGSDDVAGTAWHARTVEGDLGMRWSAPGVVAAARVERLEDDPALETQAHRRAADPALLPTSDEDRRFEARLAELAAVIATRRHARGEAKTGAGRRDLSRVRLVIGSGGVLRHAPGEDADAAIRAILADHAGGWPLPTRAFIAVDTQYRLAPAGLLAATDRVAARGLLRPLCEAAHAGPLSR